MTSEVRERILELRKGGMGYHLIAQNVGESRDAVRYICRSNGLGGFASDQTSSDRKICVNCKADISQTVSKGRPKRFCCEKCRREWWRKHPEKCKRSEKALYPAICKCCGKEFTAYGNSHRMYCSHKCYIQHRFWEK